MSTYICNYNSEMRIINNRIRRNRQLRRRVLLSLFTIMVIFVSLLMFASIKSKAAGEGDAKVYKYYSRVEVKSGDTLWTIADDYLDKYNSNKNMLISEICFINNINEDDPIYAGSYLVIPYYDDIN